MSELSIVIPALNEEENILNTINQLLPIVSRILDKYELILVNDGSSDQTGKIIDALAKKNPNIHAIHHAKRRGVGNAYHSGIDRASMKFVTLIPGDNELAEETLATFFEAVGKADLVIGYRVNQKEARTLNRVILSRLYTHINNWIFGLHLKDINSLVVYPTEWIRKIKLTSPGFTYQLELLPQMFWNGLSYVEVPIVLNPVEDKNTRSLSWRTFKDVAGTIKWLVLKRIRENKISEKPKKCQKNNYSK